MERNPLFTKERALFSFEKIEYFYKNKAYSQALSEIEKNKDLLGAVLNVGKQLSLNKIYANSIVNVMLDIFECDGDSERFDECFSKYRTTLELHTSAENHALLQTYFNEKTKSPKLKSREDRLCKTVADKIGEYIAPEEEIAPVITSKKEKDTKAKSIEEDFLNSIGKPFIASKALKDEIKAEEKELYGTKDEFEDFINPKNTLNDIPKTKIEKINTDIKSDIKQNKKEETQQKSDNIARNSENVIPDLPVIDLSNTMVFDSELVPKKSSSKKKSRSEDKNSTSKAMDKIPDQEVEPVNIKIEKNTSQDQSFDYTKSSRANKSGGKVTELSFENKTEKPVSEAPKKKTSSKKKKKKKKSFAPIIITTFIIIAIVAMGIFAIKSGILGDIKNQFTQKSAQTSSDSENPTEPAEPVAPDNDSTNPDNTVTPTDSSDNSSNPEENNQNSDDYLLPSDTKSLTEEDLKDMDKSELRYAINEMYARKGWHFDFGGDYYEYFSKKSWYKPDESLNSPSDASAKFSEIENVNLATIIKYRDSLN
ncbi:MAG: YARHG domain-containing protein [Proteocatella sp.]